MKTRDPVLGTLAEVHVETETPTVASSIEDDVLARAKELEAGLTLFDSASDMHELRRSGTTANADIRRIWALAERWHERTEGAYHYALQPLIDVWARAEQTGIVPAATTLADALASLDLATTAHLDFNALAKGWIAEQSLEVAFNRAEPVRDAWLSLGGDITHRGTGAITIGIEDPARPYDNIAAPVTIEIANESLATSGTTQRFWTVGGTRYAKVLDPRTGWPADRVTSATVVAKEAAAADALATAALVLSPDETLALIEAESVTCLLFLADGKTISSSDRFRRV